MIPKSLPKRQWLYGNHLIRKFGSATIALGAVGKSSLFIVEALALATGRELLGVKPPQRARVWLWNGEDPYGGTGSAHRGRLPAFRDHTSGDRGLAVRQQWPRPRSKIVIATQSRDGVTIAVPMVEALMKTIKR